MSLNKWIAGALAGLTLGLLGVNVPQVQADEGQRLPTRVGVVWLGSLSTGYVVGQEVKRDQDMTIVYTRVPISHLVVQDARTGCMIWQGKPYIGQTFHFSHRTNVKFTAWSSPTTEWPPMSAAANAMATFPNERPILDAIQLTVNDEPIRYEPPVYP